MRYNNRSGVNFGPTCTRPIIAAITCPGLLKPVRPAITIACTTASNENGAGNCLGVPIYLTIKSSYL